MPVELARHFENFCANLTLSLDQLVDLDALSLQKTLNSIKSMTKVSLSLDIAANLEKISYMTAEQVSKINFFVNDLDAEIKSNYFLQLKSKALKQDNFKTLAAKLNQLGFFKDQSEYLKELTK